MALFARASALVLLTTVAHAQTAVPRFELEREVANDPSDPLIGYGWDGASPSHSTYKGASALLVYGEVASDRGLFHLPLNEGEGVTAEDASVWEHAVQVQEIGWIAGRFGPGVELGRSSSIEVDLYSSGWRGPGRAQIKRAPPFKAGDWTLSMWLRPARESASGMVAEVSGAFALRLREGNLRLEVAGAGEVAAADPLEVDRWTHVAVALDRTVLGAVRLVVGDQVAQVALGPPHEGQVSQALRIGAGAEEPSFEGGVDDVLLETRATSTAELFERSEAGARAGMHELTLERKSGVEKLSIWAGALTSPGLSLEGPGGAAGAEANALLCVERRHLAPRAQGLRWVPGHWERDRPLLPPHARTTHAVAPVGEGRVWMFGGETRDTHVWPMVNTDDTWLYHADRRAWERLLTSHAPTPRCHQQAAYSPDHGLVLLVGGWRNDGESQLFDDTWAFHLDGMRWEERVPSGIPLMGLANAPLLYHPPTRLFYLFYGPWVGTYSPDRNRWSVLEEPRVEDEAGGETAYYPGSSPMTGYDPEHDVFVFFGGELGDEGELNYSDTTALYHITENRFVVRDIEVAPAPRCRAGFAYDSRRGRFVLFGGVLDQGSERKDDLWTYQVETDLWTPVDSSNTPSPRGGYYGMPYLPGIDAFVLLCGRNARERFLDEVWRLTLDERAWGSATYVFDRAEFPRKQRLLVEAHLPGEAELAVSFAGSPDNAHWTEPSRSPEEVLDGSSRYVLVRVDVRPGPSGEVPGLLDIRFTRPLQAAASEPEDDVRQELFRIRPLD